MIGHQPKGSIPSSTQKNRSYWRSSTGDPPGPKETPPEIAGLMIRAYENPLVSLISGGVR